MFAFFSVKTKGDTTIMKNIDMVTKVIYLDLLIYNRSGTGEWDYNKK